MIHRYEARLELFTFFRGMYELNERLVLWGVYTSEVKAILAGEREGES